MTFLPRVLTFILIALTVTALAIPIGVQAKAPHVSCSLNPVLEIGGPDAEEPAQFYEKIGTAVIDADSRGNVYVLDSGNCRVQVFGPDGKYLRTVGREGGGPGEFKLPQLLDVNAAGMLAVFDMGQNRLSIFDSQGELIRDQITGSMVQGLALDEDGGLVLVFEPSRGVEMEAYDPSGDLVWKMGAPIDEVDGMTMKFGQAALASRVEIAGDGSVFRIPEGEYKVVRVRNGKESGAWSRPFERVPFEMPEPEDSDGEGHNMVFIEVTEESGPDGGTDRNVSVGGGDEREMTFSPEDLKKFMPEFRDDLKGIMVWPDGRVWVPTSQTDGDRAVVDEWSPDGEHTRRLTLPDDYQWLRVGADGHLYGVTHDEDDYPLVHRLSVVTE